MHHEYSWWVMLTHFFMSLMMPHEYAWCITRADYEAWVLMMHHEYMYSWITMKERFLARLSIGWVGGMRGADIHCREGATTAGGAGDMKWGKVGCSPTALINFSKKCYLPARNNSKSSFYFQNPVVVFSIEQEYLIQRIYFNELSIRYIFIWGRQINAENISMRRRFFNLIRAYINIFQPKSTQNHSGFSEFH